MFLPYRKLALLAAVTGLSWSAVSAAAPPLDAVGPEIENDVLPMATHEVARQLTLARQAVDQHRYADAVIAIQGLLNADVPEAFVPVAEDETLHTTVRRAAGALLTAMPREGRRAYELAVGVRGQTLLDQAAADGDRAALGRLGKECFGTMAGRRAALVAAYDHLDHLRPIEAIACLRPLVEPPAVAECEPEVWLLLARSWLMLGNRERARETLDALGQYHRSAVVRVGPTEFRLPADLVAVLATLQQATPALNHDGARPGDAWTTFRGDNARNAPAAWHAALGPLRWTRDTVEDSSDNALLRAFQQESVAHGTVLLPAMQPLAVGDTVLVRTPQKLWAIDVASGKRVWEYPWRKEAENESSDNRRTPPGTNPIAELQRRVSEETAVGQLASDGRRVFLVDRPEDEATPPANVALPAFIRLGPSVQATSSRLVALDVRKEGTMAWAVGGESGEDEPRLAGAFFLGPPLVDGPSLYVLAEMKGEILVCLLDAATGRLGWSQTIAYPREPITRDLVRQMAAATPSLAEGVLVCPTGVGAVVGVDPLGRSLRWAYSYPRTHGRRSASAVDASVTIGEGCVLVTPPDADQVCCLDLATGREQWSCDRSGMLFAACIHRGKAVLVGPHEVVALRLGDRKPAWLSESVSLGDEGVPSGRGLYNGASYYLPTTDKRLLEIDLDTGRITGRWTTETPLGNLIAARGRLISQSIIAVQQF